MYRTRFNNSYMYLDNMNQSNSDVFMISELDCPIPMEEPKVLRNNSSPPVSKSMVRQNQPTNQPLQPTNQQGKCSLSKDGTSSCGSSNVSSLVFDPRTNLREAAKNMLLLEDHLLQEGMECKDCISKHLLLVDGYLSEALSLDLKMEYTSLILDTLKAMRSIMKKIKDQGINERTKRFEYAQEIRQIRKPLCQQFACFVE